MFEQGNDAIFNQCNIYIYICVCVCVYVCIYIYINQHENETIRHIKTSKVPMNASFFQLQLHTTPRQCKGDTLSMAWIMVQIYYWYIYFRSNSVKPRWQINKFCSKKLLISLDTRRFRWNGSCRWRGWTLWKRTQRNYKFTLFHRIKVEK